jgi:hypothetical protein
MSFFCNLYYFGVSHQVRTLQPGRSTVCGFATVSSSCPRIVPLTKPFPLSKATQHVQVWIKTRPSSSVLSDRLSDSWHSHTKSHTNATRHFDCQAPELQPDQQALWPTTREPHRRWRERTSRRVPLVGSPSVQWQVQIFTSPETGLSTIRYLPTGR